MTQHRILVTGICGAFGRLVAGALGKHHSIIGVDRRPLLKKLPNVEHLQVDLVRKSAYSLLKKRQPTAIVHVGVMRSPKAHSNNAKAYYFNLELTNQLLRLAEETKIRKFVFLSTANLYGPSSTSSGFLNEEAPLHGANRSPELRDLVAIDMMIQSFFWKQPTIETVMLRPVHLVGPHLNNAPSRYLRQDQIPTLLGYDPMVQIVHEADVVRAIALSLEPGVRGIFNILGGGQAPLSRLIRALAARALPVPEFIFRPSLEAAFKLGLTTYPPGEIDHLKYACLIDGSRAEKELGYKARFGLKKTLLSLRQRR